MQATSRDIPERLEVSLTILGGIVLDEIGMGVNSENIRFKKESLWFEFRFQCSRAASSPFFGRSEAVGVARATVYFPNIGGGLGG
jgi:hypothetical protein